MSLDTPPDAIFPLSDFATLVAIQELQALGNNILEDFCVVSFGNKLFRKFLELSISNIYHCPKEMGKWQP